MHPHPPHHDAGLATRARHILALLHDRRRLAPGAAPENPVHLERILSALRAHTPLRMVLPAFPAKSPNPDKVLGRCPDMGEWLALASLERLCAKISELHAPGVELLICSDGHVFADVVHVSDSDVSRYTTHLVAMLSQMGARHIRVLGMRALLGEPDPTKARRALLTGFAEDPDLRRTRAARDPALMAHVNGVHRFLFEDERVLFPHLSKARVRRLSRARAYEVVRRSDAWSRLIAARFPRALRLSIHPQTPTSPKLGINLIAEDDAWRTPWHAAPVLEDGRFRLLPRQAALARGARLRHSPQGHAFLEVS